MEITREQIFMQYVNLDVLVTSKQIWTKKDWKVQPREETLSEHVIFYPIVYLDSTGHLMCPDDPDYTCTGHVRTLKLSPSFCQSLFHSPSQLSPQICEWHVSLHLACTCIAYGHCIMASGLNIAALQCYSNTWEKKWERAKKQTLT